MEKSLNFSKLELRFGNLSLTILAFTLACVVVFILLNAPNGGFLPDYWRNVLSQTPSNPLGILTGNFIHGYADHFVYNAVFLIAILILALVCERAFQSLRNASPFWLILPTLLACLTEFGLQYVIFALKTAPSNSVGSSTFILTATGFLTPFFAKEFYRSCIKKRMSAVKFVGYFLLLGLVAALVFIGLASAVSSIRLEPNFLGNYAHIVGLLYGFAAAYWYSQAT